MISQTRVEELLDYATTYGEFDETTPNGTQSQYGERFATPMNEQRRGAICAFKTVLGMPVKWPEPQSGAEA